jgi:hypothetical protein
VQDKPSLNGIRGACAPLPKENTMTLPDERYRALKQGKKLLEELCDPGRTPRVPSLVRDRARGILRHYPSDYELERIADKCPEYLDKISFTDRMYMNASQKVIGE